MAFLLAGSAPTIEGWSSGLNARNDVHAVVSYPILNPRNDSIPANDTINMFIDSTHPDVQLAASIVTACVDQTVFAIQCTSGPAFVGSETCGPNGVIATLTSGASIYAISSAATGVIDGLDATVTVQETCNLAGTTAATCTATAKATVSTSSRSSTSTETLSGSTYYRFDVAITGGAEKTVNPTSTCAAKKSAGSNVRPNNLALCALAFTAVATVFSML